jgi:hypothetical protein
MIKYTSNIVAVIISGKYLNILILLKFKTKLIISFHPKIFNLKKIMEFFYLQININLS